MKNSEPMLFWQFYQAPVEFQDVFDKNGGDEDYLVFIPHGVEVPFVFSFGTGNFFGERADEYYVSKTGSVFHVTHKEDYDPEAPEEDRKVKEDTGKKLNPKWHGIWMVSGH